jgi:hypothetical protein
MNKILPGPGIYKPVLACLLALIVLISIIFLVKFSDESTPVPNPKITIATITPPAVGILPSPLLQPTASPIVSELPTSSTRSTVGPLPKDNLWVHGAFEDMWLNTDFKREKDAPWLFGDKPISTPISEPYGPGIDMSLEAGRRTSLYMSQARMELNNPLPNAQGNYSITFGLLTYELIRGEVQVDKDNFEVPPKPNSVSLIPARVSLVMVGGSDELGACIPIFRGVYEGGPTYRALRRTFGGKSDLTKSNIPMERHVVRTMDLDGYLSTSNAKHDNNDYVKLEDTKLVHYDIVSKHNIPWKFWDKIQDWNKKYGPTWPVKVQEEDWWIAVLGRPITEAYWAEVVTSGGEVHDVMFQAFERRLLVLGPTVANMPDEVFMTTIGKHHLDWRYQGVGWTCSGIPTSTSIPPTINSPSQAQP